MSTAAVIPPEVSRTLLVTSLPPSINGAQVYELFGEHGPIRQIRLGNESLTRGTALVVYEQCLDAQQALQHLHNRQLTKTKNLHVEYYDAAKYGKMAMERKKRRDRNAELRERRNVAAEEE